MKACNIRFVFVLFGIASVLGAVFYIFKAFNQNMLYFYTPSQYLAMDFAQKPHSSVRVGGLVKVGSVYIDGLDAFFVITDHTSDLEVRYTGILPSLFREGQGAIVTGSIPHDSNYFVGTKLLVKHDERYIPKELYQSIRDKALEDAR